MKLSEHFVLIIEHVTGTSVNTNPGSEVYLLAKAFKDLALNNKNKCRGQKTFIEVEKSFLEKKEIEIEETKPEETDDEDYKDPGMIFRKKFVDLKCKKSKQIRVKEAVNKMIKDEGIEDAILDELKSRKESSDEENKKDVQLKLFCMLLIKTLNISETKSMTIFAGG